ncbi:hypothetical protein [Roseiconus lacunae]|uniref:Outer membrane lipoprotein-sorting protein n=1 Tax=Roseiconus lacunae TaxID=2605694 RepID=A0ABT7PRI8_9BACT|nr:hypothetical protein [Roseiconus lacunae]MCD0458279.1 hypothetical protein [Roseiconus lacunae]MDM4019112.1 hypothetical protein [Roseiconus lacunae]
MHQTKLRLLPRRECLSFLLLGTLAFVPVIGIAQDPVESDSSSALKDRFTKLAERITVSAAGPPKTKLTRLEQPVLSWSNPERNTTVGALHLWTRTGRPEAALCIYPSLEKVHLEFQSLSTSQLLANDSDRLIWQPNQPGVNWKDLPDTAPPLKSPYQRLRQMRSIGRRFSAKLVPPNRPSIPLRVLERPIYRYPNHTGGDVIDGAVFSFVQGTDPEVLLLLEAYESGDEHRYRYTLARMSVVPTEVTIDNTTVWETSWAVQRSYTPYYVYETK